MYWQDARGGTFAELHGASQAGRGQYLATTQLFTAAFTLVRSQDYALLVEESTIKKILSDDYTATGQLQMQEYHIIMISFGGFSTQLSYKKNYIQFLTFLQKTG